MAADRHSNLENWQTAGFGIYIHWPFCAAKCPYCDFNSHVANDIDHLAWAEAYERDLDRWVDLTPGRLVRSVFFGGGTPSLMAPESIERILHRISGNWPLSNDAEITLEANPTSVERNRFTKYRDAGINRISLGVQALDDSDLRRLGRLHSAEEALVAVDMARSLFDRVSFDLIYARQDQTEQDWHAELSRALSLGMDHLSLYQLTIEPGTPFHSRQSLGKLPGLPTEDLAASLYELTQELCAQAGLAAYEVSNHARPGAESRHNLIYWRGGDWLGSGPGAHGRINFESGRIATAAKRSPEVWRASVMSGDLGLDSRTKISPLDQAEEYLMMSLRLTEGSDLRRLAAIGYHVSPARIDDLVNDGLLKVNGHHLAATPRGRLVLNAVLLELLTA